MSDYRAALNCSFRQQEGDDLCPRCGDPLRVHAPQGMALSDLGYIHGNHPAWVASTSEARLGAVVREAVGDDVGLLHSMALWQRAPVRDRVIDAVADAIRAEEGGEHG